MRRLFYFWLFLSAISTCSGAVSSHKMDCHSKTITWRGQLVILHTQHQSPQNQLYYIHNKSRKKIWLTHPMGRDQSAKAGWTSELSPGNWSSLLLNKNNFVISCMTVDSNKPLNCAKTISICAAKIKLDPARTGSYWLVEDKAWKAFVTAVDKRLQK